jgi:glutathione-independent formaldehyde dehydrogenase
VEKDLAPANPGRIVTYHGPLGDAPDLYDRFDQRADGVIKAVLQPREG